MLTWVAGRVENTQQDQADSADDGEGDGQPGENLLTRSGVGRKTSLVTQPPVGTERKIQQHGSDDAAGNEERLEVGGAHVADVGNALGVIHGRVVRLVSVHDPVEEQGQQGGQPDGAGQNGCYLRGVS